MDDENLTQVSSAGMQMLYTYTDLTATSCSQALSDVKDEGDMVSVDNSNKETNRLQTWVKDIYLSPRPAWANHEHMIFLIPLNFRRYTPSVDEM